MTTRLLLLRHGETDSNVEGRTQGRREVPLNAHGRRQAEAAAGLLRAYEPAAVLSSPAQRARETATPVAAVHGIEISVDGRLAELDQGDLDGLTMAELRGPQYEQFLRRWQTEDLTDLRMPGGETMGEAQRRMVEWALAMAEAYPGQTVIAVSHNLALRTLLCRALGVPLQAFRRFRTDLASLTVVDVHDDARQGEDEGARLTVVSLNERCHLSDDG